jgi:sulfur transfer protein SufE
MLLSAVLVSPQVPDPMARYKQLLFYAAKLPAMPAEQHQPENKVEGCVSQVGPEQQNSAKHILCKKSKHRDTFVGKLVVFALF